MSMKIGKRMRLVALIVLVIGLLPAGTLLAQDGGQQLVDGQTVEATLAVDSVGQVFWFEAAQGDVVNLSAGTEVEGLALALLLTDAEGLTLAEAQDADAAGTVAISEVLLAEDGRYYVTVLRAAGAGEGIAGDFTLAFDRTPAATETAPEPSAVATPTLVSLPAGMQVSLTWDSTADLDLEVRDPYGNSIYWDNPTAENAVFTQNVNANCVAPVGESPTEQVNWTGGVVPSGSYEIIVYYVQGCENNDPANVTLTVTVDGTPLDAVTGTVLPGQEFLSSFKITPAGEAAAGLSGINPGSTLANADSFLIGQTPLTPETSVPGVITSDEPFAAYSFTASTGDIVTLRMDATSGNLDTALFLLDPNGNVVAFNDDAPNADTTNSELANQTLVADGLYTVVATRYGQQFGGTEGGYTLTLSGGSFEVPPALAGLDLPRGSIEVALLWNTNADLQLLVRDPSGNAVYDDIPRGNSGGVLELNGNVNCADTTTSPVSYIYWPPDRLPPGTYEVEVWYQNSCGDPAPVTFNLTVRVNDQLIIAQTAQPIPGQVYLTNFTVDVNGFASAGAGGFIGDSSVLEIGAALQNAIPISYGDTVSGTINQTNKFTLYTFEGEAGDQIRIGMDATAGTLDTTLFLLSPDGAQLAFNDDAVINETTNSLIDNFTLPADGTYIIVATHYGLLYGGTSGTYNLSVVRLN